MTEQEIRMKAFELALTNFSCKTLGETISAARDIELYFLKGESPHDKKDASESPS